MFCSSIPLLDSRRTSCRRFRKLRTRGGRSVELCLRWGCGAATTSWQAASCKELREAKEVHCFNKGLSSAELATLGTLGSVLPSLEDLQLFEPAAGPDGVQRLAERLGAGALPAVT